MTSRRRVVRSWSSAPIRRARVTVSTQHPDGDILRGGLRPVGVAETDGPGLAGTLIWHGRDYEGHDLGTFTGNYVDAERWLLDQTAELDL